MKPTSFLTLSAFLLTLTLTAPAATPVPDILTPWTKRITALSTSVRGIAPAAGGGIYLAGVFDGSTVTVGGTVLTVPASADATGTRASYFAAYDAAGAVVFAIGGYSYGGAGTHVQVNTIANARDGSAVYVYGNFEQILRLYGANSVLHQLRGGGPNTCLFLAKLSPSGNVLWAKAFASGSFDNSGGVATDSFGNVYITGNTSGVLPIGDISVQPAAGFDNTGFLAKLDANGNALWVRRQRAGATSPNAANGNAFTRHVAVDAADKVFITCEIQRNPVFESSDAPTALSLTGENLFVAAYNAAGTLLTARPAPLPPTATHALALGRSGEVYCGAASSGTLTFAGQTLPGDTAGAGFLLKYQFTGSALTEQWARQLNSATGLGLTPSALTVDTNSNPILGGTVNGRVTSGALTAPRNYGANDAFLATFDTAGNPLWLEQLGTPAAQAMNLFALTMMPDNSLRAAGRFYNGSVQWKDSSVGIATGTDPSGFLLGFTNQPFGAFQFAAAAYDVEELDPSVTVTVQRVGGGYGPVSVTVQTADQSATAGQDYPATTVSLAWADGDTAPKTVTIPIINDTLAEPEPDETFQVRLLNPVGGAALGARAVTLVNIADNDTALPPEITVQPVNTVTEVNQSATFSVTARGSAPRTFQWRRNGANLPGQTSRTLTLNNVQPADAAIYSVKVSNPFGDTFSADVSLGVLPVGGQQFYTISEYVPAGTGLLRPGDTVSSMALDRNGDLYITTRNCIVKIAPDRVMTRIAGQLDTYGYANGQGEAAQFALPRLVLTSTGDFVVGDYNGVLRRVTKDGLVSPPFVGVAGSFASTDGTGEGGRFGGVVQVATDVADNIYFLDFPVNSFYPDYIGTKLRKVTPTGVLTTIPFTLDATVQLSPFSTGTITTSGFARDERGRFFVANFVGYPAFGGGLSFVIYTTALITEGVGTALQLLDGQFALRFHRLGNYVVAVDTSGRFQLISPYGLVSYLRRPDGNQIAVGVSANYGAGVHISDDGAGSFFYSDGSAIFKASPAAAYVAPEITLQPSSLGATAGATVNFDVTAYGTGPLTYQWRKGGTALTGQTSARLTLASVTLADAGSYDCFIQGPGGSIYSDAASLFLRPALTTAPQPVSVSEGQPAQFTAAAAGFPAPAYQWLKNGTPLPGQTGATLAFASAQPADVGFYAVAVTNIAGGITSAPVQLTVGILPTVDTPPAHQTLTNGALNLAVAASGPGPLTYQWRRNGVDLPGATTATFTLPAPTTADAGRYTVVVGNAAGTRESVAADVEFFGDLKFYSGTVIAGPIGKTYRVEHTPSLSGTPVWTLLRNVTLPFSPYLVIDENSPGVGKRFYRAVPLP